MLKIVKESNAKVKEDMHQNPGKYIVRGALAAASIGLTLGMAIASHMDTKVLQAMGTCRIYNGFK